MEIAKGIRSEQYRNLDLSNYSNQDWDEAFIYLDKRLTERYIEPADLLRDAESNKLPHEKKFGFTILAIDCLLIETIQSFYEGIEDSTRRSKTIFTNFLLQRDGFKKYFNTLPEPQDFYKDFRCGILHQAQTQGKTKVWT